MKIFSLILIVSFSLCGAADISKAARSNNALAAELYALQEEGNVFFSPFSLSSALSIAYAGAKNETADEMSQVLHFDRDVEENARSFGALTNHLMSGSCIPTVEISNSFWVQDGFDLLPNYVDLVSKEMFAGVQAVDYQKAKEQARQRINSYVESATHGKITDLLQEGTVVSDTRAVIVNTIYLKAAWKTPFDPTQTVPQPFYGADGEKEVAMMHGTGHYPVKKEEGYTLLEIPYAIDRCGMVNLACYIALPDEGVSLSDVEKKVSMGDVAALTQGMRLKYVFLALPKFSLDATLSIKEQLEQLGLNLPFSCMADFSGINGSPVLYISGIVQKAKVNFEEKGTEATAATGITMGIKSIPDTRDPIEFTADRPFLFVIADKRTQTILFAGRLAKP